MTEAECRTHLLKLTVDQRKALDGQCGHGFDPNDVEQILGVIRRTPELERWVVLFLNEQLGCQLMTEGGRAQQATLDAAKYAKWAFFAAVAFGIAGLLVTVAVGLAQSK